MDEIKKLLRSIVKKDRLLLEEAVEMILQGQSNELKPRKLSGYQHMFRIRVGNYRIIYYKDGEEVLIEAVRKRDESTYKNL